MMRKADIKTNRTPAEARGRKASNGGLQALCDGTGMRMSDVCARVLCHRQSLYDYTQGNRACAPLEGRLAKLFRISRADLRHRLGLSKQKAGGIRCKGRKQTSTK